MARTLPKKADDVLAMPGGALGVPEASKQELPPLISDQPPVSSAVTAADAARPSPPIQRFRVQRERRIMHHGSMTVLREGKVLDELNYNIQELRNQGVELVKEP